MNESTIAAIERACARLVHGYARAADFGDGAAAAALFADDGVLEMPGGKRFAGRAAIQQRLAEQPAAQVSRHVISNLLVDALDEDRARGFCYLTLYRGVRGDTGDPLPSAAPFVIGHYEDEYVRSGADWRFASRRLTFTFRRGDG
jgi:SnoaL-like domain